MKTAELK